MDKSVIESVLSCNDGDLLKATDDLQAITEVSEGDTVVGDSEPSEPIDFLYSMFEGVDEDVIKKLLMTVTAMWWRLRSSF